MGFLGDAWNGIKSGAKTIGSDIIHPEDTIKKAIHGVTDTLGMTHAPPPNPAESVDAQRARALADAYNQQVTAPGGTAGTVAPVSLDQTQADQARAIAMGNIQGLQGVANGTDRTAADALLTQGTDAAAARARGLAAAYSRSNPGAALRSGLAAGNEAQMAAAAPAAQLKANEQAAARGQIGQFSDAARAADIAAAKANQTNTTEAEKANQAADLQQQDINNRRQLGFGQLTAQETNAPLTAQEDYTRALTENNAQNQKGTGSFFSGLGSALGISDKRAKTNVKRKSLADAYADEIHGVSFTYKPGEEDGGHHEGVIAQDVEKAVPGAIVPDARGVKRVDTRHLSLASAGVIADLAKRVRAIEKANTKGRAA